MLNVASSNLVSRSMKTPFCGVFDFVAEHGGHQVAIEV
jgi:hypothetical protein